MNDARSKRPAETHEQAGLTGKKKRPYAKPGFQHEKVFETAALQCGKLAATQSSCRFNRKTS
jgi:hypothetical protein